jgi:hypothetical protein
MSVTSHNNFGKFKDPNGRFRIQSLFLEENKSKDQEPLFSLKRYQLEGNPPSLYLQYMEIADPTEYAFAMKVFGDWDHWQAIQDSRWFRSHIAIWRDDLKNKLRSTHYEMIRAYATDKTAKASDRLTAIKWLASNSGYEVPRLETRGRPSKQEVEGRLKNELKHLEETKEDLDRLGL